MREPQCVLEMFEAGIKRKYIVPHNPQQNGVAKRKNIYVVEVVKAMIHDHHLPMFMWEEAFMIAMYVHNKSPHNTLRDMTLKEAFTGVKPEGGHFRIFGCPIYIHVPKEKMTKLNPSRRKGTFVGYSESSKA
jgi:hypothetical protein